MAGRWDRFLGMTTAMTQTPVPSMSLEMKGFIDINDIHKSGSENRPLTHAMLNLLFLVSQLSFVLIDIAKKLIELN